MESSSAFISTPNLAFSSGFYSLIIIFNWNSFPSQDISCTLSILSLTIIISISIEAFLEHIEIIPQS